MMTRPVPLAAATAAIVLALAGCSAGGGTHDSTSSGGGVAAPRPQPYGHSAEPEARRGDVSAAEDPRSTFALDVDNASYGYARRQILDGQRPDPALIRPEEFVNAFAQDYSEPQGDGFSVHADGAQLPSAEEGERLLRVGLQTRGEPEETRPDATLTFVVDVSGSMGEPGRLDLVRDALHTLVDQLRPTDAVALVAFTDKARVERKMTRVSDAGALNRAIEKLRPEASTNLDDGLRLGYRVARDGFRPGTSNRVVLLSDGLANTGSTDADTILERVREEAAKQIALLGVGVGSQYGDALMERLADRGDGFVVYVSERAQARDVFVHRLPSTLAVRAMDAKAQVTFDPETVQTYRLIGYEDRKVADESFRDDRVDGGEVGPGHSVTALYAVRLKPGASSSAEAARVEVRWLDPRTREADEAYASVRVADLDGSFDGAPPRLWVDYAAASLAETLQGNRAGIGLDDLGRLADRAADRLDDPAVRDLAEVIHKVR
jgi:Ca-activated chloride channel family protein